MTDVEGMKEEVDELAGKMSEMLGERDLHVAVNVICVLMATLLSHLRPEGWDQVLDDMREGAIKMAQEPPPGRKQ